MREINLSILWHFHQPSYFLLEPDKEYFFFPWVFVHSIREYYDMGRILKETPPNVKVTFNITPTLWYQINKYREKKGFCQWLKIFEKDPSSMSEEEKIFVLRNFFSVHYEKQILPYDRYRYLYTKRGSILGLEKKVKYFSNKEINDIMFYFVYSNVSEIKKEENKILKELESKKENYSEEDKRELLNICFSILDELVEIYKDLIKEKKVELTTTPFSHPIMPLLINSNSFCVSTPHLADRKVDFSYPEDAEVQVDLALSFMKKEFKREIKGLWPAEGSVSSETLELFIKKKILFTMTDEGILERSINLPLREKPEDVRDELYRPYLYRGKNGEILIFFRDRVLSDKIGFVYKNLRVEDAVNDFVFYLERLRAKRKNLWVSVILDGENPWVYYEKGGIPFLKRFYEVLSNKDYVNFSFFEEATLFKEKGILERIHPGSWIRSEFTTWMGEEEKNEGWIILKKVRNDLKDKVKLNEKSFYSMLFAEGSDFFWWFGYDNPTFYAPEFDILFREHLKNVYRNLGKSYPEFLEKPIKKEIHRLFTKNVSGYIYPVVDGRITNFYEWANAGVIDLDIDGRSLLRYLYFGWSENGDLCLRIDAKKSFKDLFDEGFKILVAIKTSNFDKILKFAKDKNNNDENSVFYCADKIFELVIKDLQDNIYLFLILENRTFARYPLYGYYFIERKEKDYDFV
ncbi:MAG: glycoside hydrolase family 57 protein [Candidatus Hydrothermales bacterium]